MGDKLERKPESWMGAHIKDYKSAEDAFGLLKKEKGMKMLPFGNEMKEIRKLLADMKELFKDIRPADDEKRKTLLKKFEDDLLGLAVKVDERSAQAVEVENKPELDGNKKVEAKEVVKKDKKPKKKLEETPTDPKLTNSGKEQTQDQKIEDKSKVDNIDKVEKDKAPRVWNDFDEGSGVYTFPGGDKLDANIPKLGKCFFAYREGSGQDDMDHQISLVYSIPPKTKDAFDWAKKRGEFNADIREDGFFHVDWVVFGEESETKGSGSKELIKAFNKFKQDAEDTVDKQSSSEAQKKPQEKTQEAREQVKREPLVRKEEVKECLKYLFVRRELRKRWKEKADRLDWLEKNPLESFGFDSSLINQIVKDFRLESVYASGYNGSQFDGKNNAPATDADKKVDDDIGNKAEKASVAVPEDDEGTQDLTSEERAEAAKKWFKPAPIKEKKDVTVPDVIPAEKMKPIESKEESRENRKNIERYRYLAERRDLDKPETWTDEINRVITVLAAESGGPPSEKGVENNGLIKLRNPELPTIIISDIHARRQSLLSILEKKADASGMTFFDYLKEGKLNVVCLGDGMHSEIRGAERWGKALSDGFTRRVKKDDKGKEEEILTMKSDNMEMNAEMVESFNTMRMVMDLKIAFSDNFHFLRGNHDDILGRDIGWLKKNAEESAMVYGWAVDKMGEDFVANYARFEYSLPIVLSGKYFIASHSGPNNAYTAAEIKAKSRAVMFGMTFTGNEKIVGDYEKFKQMVAELSPDLSPEDVKWVIGHRAVQKENVFASIFLRDIAGRKVCDKPPFYQLNDEDELPFIILDKSQENGVREGGKTKLESTLNFVEDKKLFKIK